VRFNSRREIEDEDMARRPAKPWFRKDSQAWFICINGKQMNLGKEKEEAHRRFHEIMATNAPPKKEELSVHLAVELIELFLQWTEAHRAPKTLKGYKDFLTSFVASLPDKNIPTDKLKPIHVHNWVDAHPTWGDTSKRDAIVAVKRAFLWAEKIGYIERTPLPYIEKPQAHRRDNPISAEDFKTLLSHVKDQAFKDLLEFAWESGCRPQEARHIEAKHVNAERGRIEFPPGEAKGKMRWRFIYSTEKAAAIIGRLMKEHPEGKLFLNTRGRPWKNFAICNRFSKLKDKLGKQYAAYDLRHSFATRQLKNGTDQATVAALLGHVDATMFFRVYEHVSTDESHLQEWRKRSAK
jgi:integrase